MPAPGSLQGRAPRSFEGREGYARAMIWVYLIGGVVVGLPLLMAIVGSLLPKGHVATRHARFDRSRDEIWKTITDVDGFASWRSDVKAVELLPARDGRTSWVESGTHGKIPFEITEAIAPSRMITTIADPKLPFGGHWVYELSENGAAATLRITENGEVYNPIFRFMSRFIFSQGATLERYLRDLGTKLGQTVTPEP